MEFTTEQKNNIYPVDPLTISRRVGYCLGNAFIHAMRAPWENGVEDCDEALLSLKMEAETPQNIIFEPDRHLVTIVCVRLVEYLHLQNGGSLWLDIADAQHHFVGSFFSYVLNIGLPPTFSPSHMEGMKKSVERLKHVLANRHKDSRYFGETGLPDTREGE